MAHTGTVAYATALSLSQNSGHLRGKHVHTMTTLVKIARTPACELWRQKANAGKIHPTCPRPQSQSQRSVLRRRQTDTTMCGLALATSQPGGSCCDLFVRRTKVDRDRRSRTCTSTTQGRTHSGTLACIREEYRCSQIAETQLLLIHVCACMLACLHASQTYTSTDTLIYFGTYVCKQVCMYGRHMKLYDIMPMSENPFTFFIYSSTHSSIHVSVHLLIIICRT